MPLYATRFNVEQRVDGSCYDSVRIDSIDYCGTSFPDRIVVASDGRIQFRIDQRVGAGGWELCWGPTTPQPPPLPSPPPPPPLLIPATDPVDVTLFLLVAAVPLILLTCFASGYLSRRCQGMDWSRYDPRRCLCPWRYRPKDAFAPTRRERAHAALGQAKRVLGVTPATACAAATEAPRANGVWVHGEKASLPVVEAGMRPARASSLPPTAGGKQLRFGRGTAAPPLRAISEMRSCGTRSFSARSFGSRASDANSTHSRGVSLTADAVPRATLARASDCEPATARVPPRWARAHTYAGSTATATLSGDSDSGRSSHGAPPAAGAGQASSSRSDGAVKRTNSLDVARRWLDDALEAFGGASNSPRRSSASASGTSPQNEEAVPPSALADAMQQSFVVEGRPKRLPSLPHISIAGGDSEPPGYETREV